MKDILYIIDAHNLIFSNRDILKLHKKSEEVCREKLTNEISLFSSRSEYSFVVVFDGVSKRRFSSEQGGVLIFFSASSEDADSLIAELVRKHSKKFEISVVSDDISVRESSLSFGAFPVSTKMFLSLLYKNVEDFKNIWKHYLL